MMHVDQAAHRLRDGRRLRQRRLEQSAGTCHRAQSSRTDATDEAAPVRNSYAISTLPGHTLSFPAAQYSRTRLRPAAESFRERRVLGAAEPFRHVVRTPRVHSRFAPACHDRGHERPGQAPRLPGHPREPATAPADAHARRADPFCRRMQAGPGRQGFNDPA